jgi:hypothetical protein
MAQLQPQVTEDKVVVGLKQTADIKESQEPPPSSPNEFFASELP